MPGQQGWARGLVQWSLFPHYKLPHFPGGAKSCYQQHCFALHIAALPMTDSSCLAKGMVQAFHWPQQQLSQLQTQQKFADPLQLPSFSDWF